MELKSVITFWRLRTMDLTRGNCGQHTEPGDGHLYMDSGGVYPCSDTAQVHTESQVRNGKLIVYFIIKI